MGVPEDVTEPHEFAYGLRPGRGDNERTRLANNQWIQ